MKAPYVVLSTSSRRADLLAGIRYSISSSYLIFSACSTFGFVKGTKGEPALITAHEYYMSFQAFKYPKENRSLFS